MPSARHFLRCLNELRKRCLQGKAFGLLDLDRAVTEDGRIDRATLQKFGYDIGEKAFRRARNLEETEVSKGGRPSKMEDAEILQLAEAVLSRHSKTGTKLATVKARKDKPGFFDRHSKKKADNLIVPSMSLLSRPGTIYEQEPELQQHVSRQTWQKLLRTHFAQYRVAARRTDLCVHCKKFDELVPVWKQFQQEATAKTTSVLAAYWGAFETQESMLAARKNLDYTEECRLMYKYMHAHHQRFRSEREQLPQVEQLRLYTDIEAPLEVDLRKWQKLLTAYQWHKMSALRQHDALQSLLHETKSELPLPDTVCTFDYKEKYRLPQSHSESGSMWHAQQKFQVTCFGAADPWPAWKDLA